MGSRAQESKALSAKRTASLKQYLSDCAAGIDTILAWAAHKTRMGQP